MSTSTTGALSFLIKELINEIYDAAEVEHPHMGIRRRITPLSELISSLNLVSRELPDLSSQTAMLYLQQEGALIEVSEETEHDALAGFLYTNTSYGCIFVETDDYLARRRFSAAHELGHYLLHFRPLLIRAENDQEYLELTETLYRGRTDDPQETISGRVGKLPQPVLATQLPPEGRMEYEANQFATELLMPEEIVRGLFARAMLRFHEEDLISYLSTELLVSHDAMRWRLRNFGLLPLPERKAKRGNVG